MRTLRLGQAGLERRRLTDLVLAGRKTTTARPREAAGAADERLEAVGERLLLLDDSERSAAVLEIDGVRVTTLGDADRAIVTADDKGHPTVGAWRAAVEQDWNPTAGPLTADTPIVCVWFHVVGRDDNDG
jgi:uncharacterized protein YhfF